MLLFAMCLLTPFMFMVSIALHFLWRFLNHNAIKESQVEIGDASVANARRDEMSDNSV
jgi:hypothetical protein